MRFGKGRQPQEPAEVPNAQCARCKRIYRGPYAGTNPGREINYQDENGLYESLEDAAAKGVDTSQSRDPAWGFEHGFSHSHSCPDCKAEARAEFVRDMRARGHEVLDEASEDLPDSSPGKSGE